LVFKNPETIEVARKTTHVVFDKTGTLTKGKLSVIEETYLSPERAMTAALLLGLVADVKHPVSIAISKHLEGHGDRRSKVIDITVTAGCGVEGRAGNSLIRAGNSRWLGVEQDPRVQTLLGRGFTVFAVTVDSVLQAVFGLQDTLRPEASAVVSKLQLRDISVSILSGDDERAVESVAAELGIPCANTRSRCSPSDKQTYIQGLQNGRNTVLFCGDGTNDAVALKQASLGLHINDGGANDISESAADVVLVHPDLRGVLTVIDISRASFRRILFNFTWAGVYNLFAILLAAGAFVNARIPPEFAGLGEICSVLPVVLIAFGLKFIKFTK
jgi:Cd2+-exporting ATPase